jgi:hypothetical protein
MRQICRPHRPAASSVIRERKGSLTMVTTLGGTLRAPQGRLSLNARGLALASSKHSQLPTLGLGIDGPQRRSDGADHGPQRGHDHPRRLGALAADAIAARDFGAPAGRLSLQLRSGGQLEHIADLLPLGEDRVGGRFSADISVGATVAAPAANLTISDVRHTNFATGRLCPTSKLITSATATASP